MGAVTADHLEWIGRGEMDSLVRAGVTAVLVPGAVFNLGLTRYPPARAMIEAGLVIVLATDFNPGSSPTPSMQMILSLACTQMRMTPAEAITASTINPAYSLNRGSQVGSIDTGKQADIVLFDCSDYRQIPYYFGVNHASVVIKSGDIVVNRKAR
jgi:imidazolonepropionase